MTNIANTPPSGSLCIRLSGAAPKRALVPNLFTSSGAYKVLRGDMTGQANANEKQLLFVYLTPDGVFEDGLIVCGGLTQDEESI